MRKLKVVLLVMVMVCMVENLRANLLTNGSFESPALSQRVTWEGPDSWTLIDLYGSHEYCAIGPDTYNQIPAKDGSQLFLMRNYGIWQNTGVQVVEGVTYTLSAYAASEYGQAGDFGLMLYIADTPDAAARGDVAVSGAFDTPLFTSGWLSNPFMISFTATSAQAGKYLQAMLYSMPAWNSDTLWTDNAVLVPEPMTIGMLGIGLLFMKKRRV